MNNETYLRMLILLLPFLDFNFFNKTDFSYKELEETILLSIKYHGQFNDIDEIKNIIQYYYYNEKYSVYDLISILVDLSDSLLTYHHNHIMVDIFHKNKELNDILSPFHNKIIPFIEINRLISDNLLTVIYNYENNYRLEYILRNDLIKPISVVNFQLETVLNKGIAETHTHLFGSTPYEVQWSWIMDKLYDENCLVVKELLNGIDENKGIKFHKNYLQINANLGKMILYTSIIRILMIEFIASTKGRIDTFFDRYLNAVYKIKKLNNEECNYLVKVIRCFLESKFYGENNFVLHYGVLNKIISNNTDYFRLCLNNALSLDDLRALEEKQETNSNRDYNRLEFLFLYLCYERYKDNLEDEMFAKFFLQYIRYKNILHSLINQSSDIKGFFEFQMYFKSQHSMIDSNSVMFTPIFQTYAYDKVKYLEIRIGHVQANQKNELVPINKVINSMEKTFKKFIDTYINFLENSSTMVHAGLIMHFNKKVDYSNSDLDDVKAANKKCWYDYVLTKDEKLLRYKLYREECFLNLAVFYNLRSKYKNADKYLLAIDAASNELNMEPWVLAPVFRSVKDRYIDTLKEKMNYYDLEYNRSMPLNITYHVGEVFNSIVSGLRHVDEVVEFYGFQNGERLGHASILGIDTDQYSKVKKIISLPVIELLDNWLWLYHIKSEKNLFNEISPTYIEEKIWKIVHYIYEDNSHHIPGEINIHKLYDAYKLQFEEYDFDQKFYEECNFGQKNYPCYFAKEENDWSSRMLFYSRHCICYLKKMNSIIQVEIDDDIKRMIYREAQKYLLKKIANRGIVVETNPISNYLIGNFNSIFNHPIVNINDTYKDSGVSNHIISTINTDNPGIFSTTLSNQFGYIEQLLLDSGYSKEQVLKWIDLIRENGINSSFIYNKGYTKEQVLNELKDIQKQL